MKHLQTLLISIASLLFFSCGANKIVYPTQIEYTANPQLILDEFIPYIESMGYKVINPTDTRMTLRNQNGFFTAEYLETEWYNTGIYESQLVMSSLSNKRYGLFLIVIRYPLNQSCYMDNEEMVVFDSAPDELYRVVNALPEGLKQMVLSKAL